MRRGIPTLMAIAVALGTAVDVQAQLENIYWQPTSGTSSWFTAANWNPTHVPGTSNIVQILNVGVCSVNAGSNAVVDRVYISGPSLSPLAEVIVESGATLTVSNYFILAPGDGDYGKCTVRGTINKVNSNGAGTYIGGRNTIPAPDDCYGELLIDGGTFSDNQNGLYIGGSGTGVLRIVNGGTFITAGAPLYVGYGIGDQSEGLVVLEDGTFESAGGVNIGHKSYDGGHGTVEINGGRFVVTNAGSITVGNDAGAEGALYLNGGELEGNLDQQSRLNVGLNGGTGTFIQNGGTGTVNGVEIANGVGSSGTAIFSNGLFIAKSTNNMWTAFDVGDGGTMLMAGGTFEGSGPESLGYVRDGGTLELRSGSLSLSHNFYAYTNSTIRIVGPLCDFSFPWWRGNSDTYRRAGMELILTQDDGHLASIEQTGTSACAVPYELDVGFDGGACLLSTNALVFVRTASHFENTPDPTAYGLELWDSARVLNYDGAADGLQISLKGATDEGDVTLPTDAIPVSDKAYGYLDVEGLDTGTLPELLVSLAMTEVDGTMDDIVSGLRAAGYPNTKRSGNVVTMAIPAADVPAQTSGYFAWDFREFDGSTNATVGSISFQFVPRGTLIAIQ